VCSAFHAIATVDSKNSNVILFLTGFYWELMGACLEDAKVGVGFFANFPFFLEIERTDKFDIACYPGR
jgi:hypothetical protein